MTKTRAGLPNTTMIDLVYRNLEQIGPPAFDDEAREFGWAIQTNLEMPPMDDDPLVAVNQRLSRPADFEATVRRTGRVQRAHRRRRCEVGGAVAAAQFRPASRFALAGICYHRARRGTVDSRRHQPPVPARDCDPDKELTAS
jgi:hypothetical protein